MTLRRSRQPNPVVIEVEEQKKPGRVLRGLPGAVVSGVAFAAGLLAIGQFRPLSQGSQFYLDRVPNYTQVIARKDSGISSIQDMRGKRVSTGSPGSGTEVIANRLRGAARALDDLGAPK